MIKQKKYFTILEILMSVFILSIGLISILAVFPASMELGTRVNDKTMGARAAKTARAVLQIYCNENIKNAETPAKKWNDNPYDIHEEKCAVVFQDNDDFIWSYIHDKDTDDSLGTTIDLRSGIIEVTNKITGKLVGTYRVFISKTKQ